MRHLLTIFVTICVGTLIPRQAPATMWRVVGPFGSAMSADGACVPRTPAGDQTWLDCEFGDGGKTTFLMVTLSNVPVLEGRNSLEQRRGLLGQALSKTEWHPLFSQIEITSGFTRRSADVSTLVTRGFLYDSQERTWNNMKSAVAMKVVASTQAAVAVVVIGNFQYFRHTEDGVRYREERRFPETVEAMLSSFQLDL